MTPLLILMKVLALSAVLAVLASAHFVLVDNRCSALTFTGTVSDIRWQGRSKPLIAGRIDTEGDTEVHLTTKFGTVTAGLHFDGSTMTTQLKPTGPGAPKGLVFNGTLGFDLAGSHPNETTICSAEDSGGCSGPIGVLNGQLWPAFAKLQFACDSDGPVERKVTAYRVAPARERKA